MERDRIDSSQEGDFEAFEGFGERTEDDSGYKIVLKGAVFNKYIERVLPKTVEGRQITDVSMRALIDYAIGLGDFSTKEQAVADDVSTALNNRNGFYATVYSDGDRNSPVTLNQEQVNSRPIQGYSSVPIAVEDGDERIQQYGVFEISVTVDSEGGLEDKLW